MNLYWGDLHNHCGISYGYGGLENALDNAKTHLDFCCVTGHAMWPDMYPRNPETDFIVDFHERGFEKLRGNWPEVRRTVNEANTERLVTFQSYEIHSSRYGDHHLVSPDGDLPLIYRDSPGALVRDCGCRAIAVPHHIGYTPGYRGIDWQSFDESVSPIVEVCSKHGCSLRENTPFMYYHDMGPLDGRNTVGEGLRLGKRFSFVGSTDHHAGFPGSYGDGIAAVYAGEKTREGIWDALLKGHTYAATGDRIECRFTLNDAMMGDSVRADRRVLRFFARGDAPMEALILRRNGRVAAGKVCVPDGAANRGNRYILRVEMGWGNSPEKYHWEASLAVNGGRITRVQPYLRGKNALSPSDRVEGEDRSNAFDDGFEASEDRVDFRCDTFCNVSTLHPMTCAFVFEIEARSDARIEFKIGSTRQSVALSELVTRGISGHVKPWHSQAWKLHAAYPLSLCQAELEWFDAPCEETDVYQAEAVQTNGQRAFCSPIFAGRE